MPLIKLNAIDSTNSYLRKLSIRKDIEDYTVVVTKNQTNGRGQMGASWHSETSKNLTFSVFKELSNIYLEHPFYISIVTSLALIKALQFVVITKLSIKWPNDILAEDKKICGILIENVIQQNQLKASIIGVGLNVNQTTFGNLPRASSLKLITGMVYNLDEVLHAIIKNLEHYFEVLKAGNLKALKDEYETYLFRKNKPSTFRDAENNIFTGYIKSVSDSGSLQVLLEDGIIKAFDLKEITLLY